MFSLYRGELHKVSGVPRQWTIPKSQIPLSVFKKALVKRNAALNKLSQSSSSSQKADPDAFPPTANGTGGHYNPEFDDESGEFEERGGADNYSDSEADSRAENATDFSDRNVTVSRGEARGVREEGKRRRERKRRREQDLRDEFGRRVHRKDESANSDAGEFEASTLGQWKDLQEEPMMVDVVDQLGAMDCDGTVSEKAVMDFDEARPEKVRVRVPELGESSELDGKQVSSDIGTEDTRELKQKDMDNPRRNGEVSHLISAGVDASGFEKLQAGADRIEPTVAVQNGGMGSVDVKMKDAKSKRKAELEARLEKLRADKHRYVLTLKRVLNEEEMRKKESLASGSPKSRQGAVIGHSDSAGGGTHQVEVHGVGGARASADLEDGELEYARTPSPPSRTVHASAGPSHNSLGPSPVAPGTGRQAFVPQHTSQNTTARGGYFVPNLGIPPSSSASAGAGGALSPGAGYVGNMSSPSGNRPYPHNLAMQQHAAAMYGQKVSSGAHGHGQFNALQSSGGSIGVSPPGVAGGPPGFSGYPMTSSVHSHHSHLSQQASSSPHIAAGQPGVSSSPLLTTPRGPPYHDVRLGGGAWIQR